MAETKIEISDSAHGRAGFVAGIVFGAFLGAGLALLFAPERGGDMRKRLRGGCASFSPMQWIASIAQAAEPARS